MYLRNQWYVAAWGHEVGRTPMQRWLLDEPLVFYRTEAGEAVVLSDRCPHRSASLSMGEVIGDTIQCGYHGLRFGPDGGCVEVPGEDAVPAQIRARRYAAVEKWGWLFVWMGDPDKAAEEKIPDYHWLTDPAWAGKGGTINVKASYELLRDNLMDLTHAKYVHKQTLATDAVTEFQPEATVEGDVVHLKREMIDIQTSPFFVKLGGFTQNVDHKQNVRCYPPAHIVIDVGAWPTAGSTEENWAEFRVLNALTPETSGSTHYFWSLHQNFDIENDEKTQWMHDQNLATFMEDVAVVEAQQRLIESGPGPWVPVTVKADRAVVLARRVFDRLLEEEQAASAGKDPASAAE